MSSPRVTAPELQLLGWRGWLPQRAGRADSGAIMTDERPAAAAVPAMLRRRLTPMGRAVCELLSELDIGAGEVPILHASRHGDGHRPLDMLDTLAAGEPLSPARFGLSVHNAVLGVYSIAAGNHTSMAAIAAAGEEFEALLAEARGYLAEGCDSVVLVLTDSPVPARYRIDAPEYPAAVALQLSLRDQPGSRTLTSEPRDSAEPAPITVAQLVDWLTDGAALATRAPPRRWRLAPAGPA
ncbi:beta-ketoacyl synthase chain length factor [Kushneria aurantia]|uniref:Beta-ketoacyl synthase chain length factor n=1 Tax=Kushneria aurantia TaxID=504092 RepID=A0ABV6FZ89_9GAMM|nr:beta-ketoacyl synthase chain length factor [Kushneria aurantia]